MKRKSHSRGFTLVELMITTALIGILAALSVASFNRNQVQNEIDNWIGANRDAVRVASRRAVATGQPYMVEFTPSTVQWCLVNNLGTGSSYTGAQQTCVGLPFSVEQGPLVNYSFKDVQSAFYTPTADIVAADGSTYAAPAKTTLSTRTYLYFGRGGAVSTTLANVMQGGIPQPAGLGFTLYARRKSNDLIPYRRKLVVYGLSGKTRVLDTYN